MKGALKKVVERSSHFLKKAPKRARTISTVYSLPWLASLSRRTIKEDPWIDSLAVEDGDPLDGEFHLPVSRDVASALRLHCTQLHFPLPLCLAAALPRLLLVAALVATLSAETDCVHLQSPQKTKNSQS